MTGVDSGLVDNCVPAPYNAALASKAAEERDPGCRNAPGRATKASLVAPIALLLALPTSSSPAPIALRWSGPVLRRLG
jgi:hypothetical protein